MYQLRISAVSDRGFWLRAFDVERRRENTADPQGRGGRGRNRTHGVKTFKNKSLRRLI